MKKTASLFFILLNLCFAAAAQEMKPELSPGFDEPEGLESKVVQCTNGNTFLFNFTKKEGIEVTLFDKTRQIKSKETIVGKEWDPRDMARSTIDGIYEINGQQVMFLEQLSDKTPLLYRLIFDDNTGKVVSETKIAEMPRYTAGAGYAMAFGHVEAKSFHVEKDRNSDAYAVIVFDGFAEETAHRIELIHFDGNHKEINRAYYDAPENRYKFINFIAMTVDGTSQVFLCTYAYGTHTNGGKASRVFMSRLSAGSKEMEHHPVDGTLDFKDTRGILEYNAGLKKLELLTQSFIKTKNSFLSMGARSYGTMYFGVLYTVFDPVTLNVEFSNGSIGTKLQEFEKLHFGKKEKFEGMAMDMIINPDNTTTIVFEEKSMISYNSGNGIGFAGPMNGFGMHSGLTGSSSTKYDLGNVGIVDINAEGDEINGYVIKKDQVSRMPIPALSLHNQANNYVTFENHGFVMGVTNSGFYSFNYEAGDKNGRYVIFNDRPDNFDRDEKKDPKTVQGISDCNTVCFKLKDGKLEKFYLYGAPDKGFDNRFTFLSSSNYLRSTNTYATLLLEKNGRKKQAFVSWIVMQ